MGDSEAEAQFKQQFMARVAEARNASGLTQLQMAEALGMPQDKYKQYEGRSYLPYRLIARFCVITRSDPVWLVTGRGQKPIRAAQFDGQEAEPVSKPKRGRSRKAA